MSDVPTPLADASGDVLALTGYAQLARWNLGAPLGTGVAVTYSFGSAPAAYDTTLRLGFTAFTPAQQAYARGAFDTWGAASGITFVEVPEGVGGQIRLGMVDTRTASGVEVAGFAYMPQYRSGWAGPYYLNDLVHNSIGGDIFLSANLYGWNDAIMAPGRSGYSVLLHEIGHAIGFKHPFEGNPVIDPARDSGAYTVLSYNRPPSTTALGTVDVVASQLYYGVTDVATSFNAATRVLSRIGTGADEWVTGTELADNLAGLSGADSLLGMIGADTLSGGNGDDVLVGGAGGDRLAGGAGYDIASWESSRGGVAVYLGGGYGYAGEADRDTFESIESLRGSPLADALAGSEDHNIIEGGAGADTIAGLGGNDWISFETAVSGIAVNLDAALGWIGDAAGDAVSGIENIRGSRYDDMLFGDSGANILRGDWGADTLYGAANSDTIYYSTSTAAVRVDLSTNSAGGGDAAGDMLVSVENVFATAYGDVLIGDSASNTLVGWFGADTLTGNGGNDIFRWSAAGESGTAAATRDVVTDFYQEHGDLLDVSGLDADPFAAGDQAFAFIGWDAFSGVAQLRFAFDGLGNTIVEVATGAGAAAMQVQLARTIFLVAGDFVL